MKRTRLRTAILVPWLASFGIVSLAVGVFVDQAVTRDLVASLDAELFRTSVALRGPEAGRRPPGGGSSLESAQPVVRVIAPDGTVEARGSEDSALVIDGEALVGRTGALTVDGDPRYRLWLAPGNGGVTHVVALPLEGVDESRAALRKNLLIGGAALVAVQGLVALAVARAVSRPVRAISETAHRISAGNLDADFGPPSGPVETVTLREDLTVMVDRLRHTIASKDAATSDALQSRADMQRFMADASHELRTPLTALQGYADLYRKGMLDQAGLDRAMDRIGGEGVRLTALVEDLLDLVRPQADLEPQPVDVAAIVSAVAYDLRAVHPDRRVSHGLSEHEVVSVAGDPNRLHQAILNLGANACRHTEAGTSLEFTIQQTPTVVSIRVIDHGGGIDPARADHLFEPFARGDQSRSRRSHDGAGLGLALVRRIAEQHGGSVSIEETPGGGATFVLELPTWSGDVVGQSDPGELPA